MSYTKEEILGRIIFEDAQKMLLADSEITREHNGISYTMVRSELAIEAMSIYSRQQGIAFNKWLFDNKLVPNSSFMWFNHEASREDVRFFDLEELYSVFSSGEDFSKYALEKSIKMQEVFQTLVNKSKQL